MVALLMVASVLVALWFVFYIVHIVMVVTDGECIDYAFASWRSFIKCYNNRSWHIVGRSLFSDNDNGYIGYSVFRFDAHGMILDPVSFLIYGLWSRRYKPKNNKGRFVRHCDWK